MGFRKLAAAAIAAVALATSFSVSKAEEAVVTLTDSNFDEFVKGHEFVLAEFYAPWCGHCKHLAPEYEKAAQALKKEHPEVVLAKIDATVEKTLAEKFEIGGFPTLKWIVKGQAKEYSGGRTEATIINWIKKKVGPSAKPIANAADLDAFKAANEVVVVGLFKSDADAKAFLTAAADSELIPYGIAVGDEAVNAVKGAAGASGAGSIVLFKKFDDPSATFAGDANDAEAISKFVAGNSLPLVTPFSQENAQKIFGGAIKQHVLLFTDKSKTEEHAKVVEAAKPVAKAFLGQYLIITVDKTDARILEFFGVKEGHLPTARVVVMGEQGMKKYKIAADTITTETIKAFVTAHAEGKLAVDLKSEEIPATQDGDVFVLVAKQFNEIVKAPNHKNVLLEIYAPWCGHCKKLAPIYDELAKKYKGNDNLIIAKMDGTANEVESMNVGGFPTLKFFPAGSDEVVDYNGGRELPDFIKFLEEKGLKA